MRKVAALALVGGFLAACIIADPLPEQRSLPTRTPSIMSVDPASSRPLLGIPDGGGFNVTLRLYNPAERYQWRVFVDYEEGVNPLPKVSGSEPGRSDAPDVQVVTFSLSRDAMDPQRCHVIEFVVALAFGAFPHNGDPTGADSVSWNYVPNGDYSKCIQYDASVPDAGPVDAGRDGSDASP
ncbi:hypothetical protein LZC95_23410 [Pendulispora brunnea]|uniref:Lipoprotein n=1 Tax=Pendulispora brunnea TaxID=2905690 RepID=A0ABZ2KM60_9BACT